MKQFLSTINTFITSILSPPACAFCYTLLNKQSVLCDVCLNNIDPIVSHTLSVTSRLEVKVYALSAYKNPLKRLILAKQYGNRAVSKQLGNLIWFQSLISYADFDYIVPIPLHWRRYARRGYNQAETMAEEIARLSGKPVANILRRVKATEFQAGLNVKARHENVKEAFALKVAHHDYKNKKILLVDDLMTTGSTLKQASKTLLTLKPLSIAACVVCRVV